MKPLLLLLLAVCGCGGCETYSKQGWTPDGINYTLQRDRDTGAMSDYFGLSWSLKK